MKVSTYILYAVVFTLLIILTYFLPYSEQIKLTLSVIVLGALYLIKEFWFSFLNFEHIYKKAKETATGAGMILISASIVVLGILSIIASY